MTTRLHRSEVRHQLSRIARAGGPNISTKAIERHLGYPLAEADHANLRGVAAALAAIADALTNEACEVREELGVRFTFPDGLYNDCWLNDQAAINRAVAHPGVDMAASPLRRLVITTPPVSSAGEEKTR